MKIVEDSSSRLVMKEGAVGSHIAGAVLIVVAIVVAVVIGVSGTNKSAAGGYIVAAIFLVFGVIVMLTAKSDAVTVDKTARQLSVRFMSLTNRSGKSQQCSFDDVQSVQLSQEYRSVTTNNNINNNGNSGFSINGIGTGNTQTNIQLNLAVLLKNGSVWTIANEQRQIGMSIGITSSTLVGKGEKLATALGVPFNQMQPPTFGQAVKAVKDIISGNRQPESFVPTGSVQPAQQPELTSYPQQQPLSPQQPVVMSDNDVPRQPPMPPLPPAQPPVA